LSSGFVQQADAAVTQANHIPSCSI